MYDCMMLHALYDLTLQKFKIQRHTIKQNISASVDHKNIKKNSFFKQSFCCIYLIIDNLDRIFRQVGLVMLYLAIFIASIQALHSDTVSALNSY